MYTKCVCMVNDVALISGHNFLGMKVHYKNIETDFILRLCRCVSMIGLQIDEKTALNFFKRTFM